MSRTQALKAVEEGKTLAGGPFADYPGMKVEYLPRKDPAGTGNPDFYPWHVVGRPDYDRMNVHQLVVEESE